jgi:hypothetical protein
MPAEAVAKVTRGSRTVRELNGYWASASDRVVAAEQLLWQDPEGAVDVVLALVADVNLDDGDRVKVIRLAVEMGPAVQLAAGWLLDRINSAFLEGFQRARAEAEVWPAHPGGNWWPLAHALIARNPAWTLTTALRPPRRWWGPPAGGAPTSPCRGGSR